MKTKLALFLFALGLGSSMAVASTPCTYQCDVQYRSCLQYSSAAECRALRLECYGECM
ncbi:hypothetical protein [Rugamonas rubra]|uniref:Uncharacterized protein n=1 Tax=Rugamonas rubra TaxID=758825 RepID=A0A1I4T2Q0_9BURK|nr:hypothetical protein [Rugamonas rubra]SFM71024.1 hypothetical protein SAMN02982985_05024 [Rugamonas rubra]